MNNKMNDIIRRILLDGNNKSTLKLMKVQLAKIYNETDDTTVKAYAGFFHNLIVKYLKSNDFNDYLKLIKECLNVVE